MKIALLGDSVFDNGSYVDSESESVFGVLKSSGESCELYAVDGTVISSVYSQWERLEPNLKNTQNIFLSVGGNNALGSLHLIADRMQSSEKELMQILDSFFAKFEDELHNLYEYISDNAGKIPVYVANIYYPCFDFANRGFDFQALKATGNHLKILKIVDHLNVIIEEKAQDYYFGVMDINSAFHSKGFYANEIEPSFQGSQLLAGMIRDAMREEIVYYTHLESGSDLIKVPIVSRYETILLEEKIRKDCDRFTEEIPTMSARELIDFQINHFQAYDLARQLVPGQIPTVWFNHSRYFEDWEAIVFDMIEERTEVLGEEYDEEFDRFLDK
jgi:hypothetical protein